MNGKRRQFFMLGVKPGSLRSEDSIGGPTRERHWRDGSSRLVPATCGPRQAEKKWFKGGLHPSAHVQKTPMPLLFEISLPAASLPTATHACLHHDPARSI